MMLEVVYNAEGGTVLGTEIVVALIGLISSVLVQFIGILVNSKLTNYRIEQLEKEVAKHNNLVDRVYKLEQDNAIQNEKIAVVTHRVENLEKDGTP